jgi:hypothetical protein
MRVRILEEITLSKRVLHPGEIIDVPDSLLPKLGGRVKPLSSPGTGDPQEYQHFCKPAGSWCSEKLPGSHHPEGCIRIGCEYHPAAQDTPQTTNTVQGISALAVLQAATLTQHELF